MSSSNQICYLQLPRKRGRHYTDNLLTIMCFTELMYMNTNRL